MKEREMSDNNNNDIAKLRKLLEDSRNQKASEYQTIASLIHNYQFRDPKIHKEAQKLLQATRRYYKNLDDQIKVLDSGATITGVTVSSSKRKGRTRKGGTLANRLVQKEREVMKTKADI